MALAGLLSRQWPAFPLPPGSSSGSQLFQQTFCCSQKFLHMTTGWEAEVDAIEDGNLEKDLRPIPPLGREHHAMRGGLRMFAGLEHGYRLEEDSTETMQFSHKCMKLRIIAERQMVRIIKCGIEVELEPDLNECTCPILDVERIVIETHFAMHDHLMQGRLA